MNFKSNTQIIVLFLSIPNILTGKSIWKTKTTKANWRLSVSETNLEVSIRARVYGDFGFLIEVYADVYHIRISEEL